jgi:hypothetical protein
MKPAPVDLPTIWRGCDWDDIILRWKDANGDPMDLRDWYPLAMTTQFSLNARKTATLGETRMSLTKEETTVLKLGVYQWNWIFSNTNGSIPPPFLSGHVEVKNPIVFT